MATKKKAAAKKKAAPKKKGQSKIVSMKKAKDPGEGSLDDGPNMESFEEDDAIDEISGEEDDDDLELEDYQETGKTGRKIEEAPKREKGFYPVKMKVVKNDHLFVGYARIENDGASAAGTETIKRRVHPDLKNALSSLALHHALLCDYISIKQLKSLESYNVTQVEKHKVYGVSIGGNDGEGITIMGYRLTDRGTTVQLCTPFTRFDEVAETRYRYMDDLISKLEVFKAEVKMYLSGEKKGELDQLEMFPGASAEVDKQFGDERDGLTEGEAN